MYYIGSVLFYKDLLAIKLFGNYTNPKLLIQDFLLAIQRVPLKINDPELRQLIQQLIIRHKSFLNLSRIYKSSQVFITVYYFIQLKRNAKRTKWSKSIG